MIVSATTLANDSKAVIDRVLFQRENADVRRHGKTVVQIRRKAGLSKTELLARFRGVGFSAQEQKELRAAMTSANDVFTHVHRA